MTRVASPQGKKEKAPAPAKKKTFIVIIRPEFKSICQDDACRAGIFNHILYNIARAKQQNSEYWHSTGEDIWEETQRSWGKSKTLKEIKDLVTTGMIAQTSNPHNSWDRTKYYSFGKAEAKVLHDLCVKNKVCLVSIKFPSAVTHLLNLTNAFCKNNKCICCNQQIDLLNPTNRFVKSEIETGLEEALEAASEAPKDSTQDSTQDSFFGEHETVPETSVEIQAEEKKEVQPHSYSQSTQPTAISESDRLQENKAHQSSNPTLFQDTVPAEKSAAPKVVLPDMTKDLLQRDTRQPTAAEQKRIDAAAQREIERQLKKRESELWDLFDRLFEFPVDRLGYNKPRIPKLAANPLATDEIIKIGFDAVLNDPRTKSNPARLTITTIADELPAHIRAHRIKAVQSSKPKEETALEKIYRERREVAARLQNTQKEIAQ